MAGKRNADVEACLFVQRGVISRRQALDAGMTPGQVRSKLDSRQWVFLEEGVYRERFADRLYTERVLAQTLRTGGVASHRCAARLLGIDRHPRFEGIEVVTTARFVSSQGVAFHEIREPYFDVVYAERGIPVTSIPWTLAMLGAVAPRDEVEWGVDWAVRKRWASWQSLDEFVRKHSRRGRPGLSTLREVLDLRGPAFTATDSILETMYLQLVRGAGLPAPVQQLPIHDRNRVALRADFAYPEHKVIIETLGRGPHDPRTAAFDDDRARVNTIKRLMPGWTVLEFTWNHVTRKRAWVIATTRHFLRVR